jgi:hypothetical protein
VADETRAGHGSGLDGDVPSAAKAPLKNAAVIDTLATGPQGPPAAVDDTLAAGSQTPAVDATLAAGTTQGSQAPVRVQASATTRY